MVFHRHPIGDLATIFRNPTSPYNMVPCLVYIFVCPPPPFDTCETLGSSSARLAEITPSLVVSPHFFLSMCARAKHSTYLVAGSGAGGCVRHVLGCGGRERAAASSGVAGPPAADGGCAGDLSRGEFSERERERSGRPSLLKRQELQLSWQWTAHCIVTLRYVLFQESTRWVRLDKDTPMLSRRLW